MIRPVTTDDAQSIAEVYNHYVMNTIITFEEDPVSSNEVASRIEMTLNSGLPWLVDEIDGQIAGYANASYWRKRVAYRYTVESAVYVSEAQVGNGIGSRLYAVLLDSLRSADIHTVVGGISLPNPASIRLHEKFGFKKVSEYAQVGRKFEKWIDIGFWQLMLKESEPVQSS